MRLFVASVFVFLLPNLLLDQALPTAALIPHWVSRSSPSGGDSLENTCQCDCCYPVGSQGRTECVPPIDTSFDVPTCSKCDVDACADRFPVACAQSSSIVNSDCITRKGWMLRMVPIFFIIISTVLLCYGFFFKKFDGYHDDRAQIAPIELRAAMPQQYSTFSTSYGQPAGLSLPSGTERTVVRSSSTLAPISENEELPSASSHSDLLASLKAMESADGSSYVSSQPADASEAPTR